MKPQKAPGTTFKRHMNIARGLLSEDDFLLSEILFNPNTSEQLEKILGKLTELHRIVKEHDADALDAYLTEVRGRIARQTQ